MAGTAPPPGTPPTVPVAPFEPAPDEAFPPAARRALRRAPEQREMAMIAGLSFFLYLFAGSILQLYHVRWGVVLTQGLFIAGPALLAVRLFYLDPTAVLPLRRPRAALLAATLLLTFGLNHLLTLAATWQERVLPSPEALREFFAQIFAWHGPADFALVLLTFAVVPAVCEEILFRGFLQAGLVRAFDSPGRGIAATAIIFAGFHLDPWRFPGILVLGLFLGALTHHARSLVPAMIAHGLNNVLSIVLSVWPPGEGAPAPGPLTAAAFAACVAALLLLRAASAARRVSGDREFRVL